VSGPAGALDAPPLGARAQLRLLLPFIAITLIWSSTWLVIRGQLGTVAPAWSIAYRFALASLVLFAWLAARRERLGLPRSAFGLVAVIALSQFALNYLLVYAAEGQIASGLVALLFALLVVPNAILGWLVLGVGISRRFLIGSIVALAGVVLLATHELAAGGMGRHAAMLGIGYSLAGVLAASVANVAQATRRAAALPKVTLLAHAMWLGALIDAAWAWATGGPPGFDFSPAYIAGLVYLGVLGSSIAFVLYLDVIRAIGPARAAYSSVLIPIIAMLLSTVFEHYVWGWQAALGCALSLAGLLIAIRARNPAR